MDDLDSAFLAGLKDDISVFDGKVTIRLIHILKNPQIDFDNGSIADGKISYEIEHCLIRNLANRSSSPQKAMGHTRQMSIQSDTIPTEETVIEIPMLTNLMVSIGDTIEILTRGTKWRVCAVDSATLTSRIRASVQRLS